MAYCDRCGSYIPDGWTTCPACGYSKESEAAQQQAAQAQTHQAEQEKFAREEAEKRRAQRQAYDKVWAENEQRRRQEEEDFRRRRQEQEERSRREREARRREKEDDGPVRVTVDPDGTKRVQVGDRVHVVVNPDGSKKVQVDNKERYYAKADLDFDFGKAGDKVRDLLNSEPVNRAEATIETAGGKILPLISYLGPLCFIPLILGKDRFTKFHANQGLRLFIWGAILEAVGSFFHIGWAGALFQALMAIIGIKNVVNGEEKKLPYIGG